MVLKQCGGLSRALQIIIIIDGNGGRGWLLPVRIWWQWENAGYGDGILVRLLVVDKTFDLSRTYSLVPNNLMPTGISVVGSWWT